VLLTRVKYCKIPYNLNPVNKDKKFWCDLIIWGELYGDVHIMDDRQISESPQEVHKRGGLKIKY
jgi:hypothetical protein